MHVGKSTFAPRIKRIFIYLKVVDDKTVSEIPKTVDIKGYSKNK